jgi:hypothetical protein
VLPRARSFDARKKLGHRELNATLTSSCATANDFRIDSEPLSLLVGPAAERLFAHKGLLTTSSEFFIKALSKDWKEGVERTVKLPEACPTACRIYIKWLYNGHISCSPADKGTFDKETNSLLDCYSLGDYLQDADFLDAVIDGISEHAAEGGRVPVTLARTVYPVTAKDSLHRKLCRDIITYVLNREEFAVLHNIDNRPEFLVDMLVDIAPQLAKGIPTRNIAGFREDKGGCEYHEHVRLNKPCYKVRFNL